MSRTIITLCLLAPVVALPVPAKAVVVVSDNMDAYVPDSVPPQPPISDWSSYYQFGAAGPWSFNVAGSPSTTAARGSEWGASNNGHIYDRGNGNLAVGVYAGATGDIRVMTYTHTLTAADIAAITSASQFQLSFDVVGSVPRLDDRAGRLTGNVVGIGGSLTESSYFGTGDGYTSNVAHALGAVDMGEGGIHGGNGHYHPDGPVQSLTSPIFDLNALGPFSVGDPLALLFEIPENDDGNLAGANAKNIGLAVDNLLLESIEQTPGVIPEPGTLAIWSLLAAMGIGVGWRRRRG